MEVYIGNYVHFASNIGIISGNHSLYNQKIHETKDVVIEDFCWIGMNVVVLPGVHLRPRTIVGVGSVVTKSFTDGYCVIGGNPARLIKKLDENLFVPTKFLEEFFGYVPKEKIYRFARKYLKEHRYYKEFVKE